MKKITLIALALVSSISFAQQEEPTSNWKKGGLFSLLFNQAAFNNDWQGGGVSSLALNGSVNYDVNYKKDKTVWDTKFILAYGSAKIDGDDFSKTNDRLEINSLWGKQATDTWYYSAFANFKTQFDLGLASDGTTEISDFFSPAYLQFGPGMLWKKSDNLKVNIAPVTGRIIYVNSRFTDASKIGVDETSFGVAQGENFKYEFGASLSGYYKLDLFKNVSMENILNVFANYVPTDGVYDAIDVDYTVNIAMKINEFLSANITGQAIYDKNAVDAVQIREAFGLGFNYKLK